MVPIEWNPKPRVLRQFSALFLVAFGLLGWVVLRKTGWWPAAIGLWTTAGLVATLGLIRPALVRRVYVGMMVLAFPIGWVVSHLLLAVVLYLVLTPIGWVMRLLGHDPLALRRKANADSYWISRRSPVTIQRYFRQF